MTPTALGWRIHGSDAVVVGVVGPAERPTVLHREHVVLLADSQTREPYHAAGALPRADAPAFIESVARAASTNAEGLIRSLVRAIGAVTAVGVAVPDRALPDLNRILVKHALLHAAERALYARAVVDAATKAGLDVVTVPATGTLIKDASRIAGVDLAPVLSALGKAIGPPWQKEYREAAAVGLAALAS